MKSSFLERVIGTTRLERIIEKEKNNNKVNKVSFLLYVLRPLSFLGMVRKECKDGSSFNGKYKSCVADCMGVSDKVIVYSMASIVEIGRLSAYLYLASQLYNQVA
ncbi:MAG TPA: hypothetical protein VJH37_01865 [Candidatus Nanoarchaeia archaeon]|nr:hypothetical protein [Candidatus Nanoarchaeia archaeon]